MGTKPATLGMRLCLSVVLAIAPPVLLAQRLSNTGPVSTIGLGATGEFDLDVAVRDAHGNVIASEAVVRVSSERTKYNAISAAPNGSPARFHRLATGEYDVEVTCTGYRKTKEHVSLDFGYGGMPVYVYLAPESDSGAPRVSTPAVVLPPQLRPNMERAMEDLRKGRYAAAEKTLTKLLPKSRDNPDVLYNLGVCEMHLQNEELARRDFERALATDPNHDLALDALAQMELHNGSPATAVPFLERAVASGRAGWRADFDLASAYLQLRRLGEAESEAARAARLAKSEAAAPLYLLGQIQYAAGKKSDAKRSWESLAKAFASDPLAAQANKGLAELDFTEDSAASSSAASLPFLAAPELAPSAVSEHPWAPPDVDSVIPDVAPGVACDTEAVIDTAFQRMKSQLLDFEKFTATERIEQEEIDRYGWPGPPKSRQFSYLVLVYPLGKNSMYLEESRYDNTGAPGVHDAIATTSLNALGVNVLQPYYRDRFTFTCEGLARLRGLAAWQVHFEQKPDVHDGIRSWKTNRKTYDIPLKGWLWISSTNFSVLRVETDLREAIKELQLNRDHLLVEYGPVQFASGSKQLWLPWTAEMFVDFHGKRYHYRHSLTNYLLFAVDTSETVSKPHESPRE